MTTSIPATGAGNLARGQNPHSTVHATPVHATEQADEDEIPALVTDEYFATTRMRAEDNAYTEIPDDPDMLVDKDESTIDQAEPGEMPPSRYFTTREPHAAGDYGVYTAVVIPLAAPWADGEVDILS